MVAKWIVPAPSTVYYFYHGGNDHIPDCLPTWAMTSLRRRPENRLVA
jgi:hypothetical protein